MTLTEILIAVMIVSILGTFAAVTYVRTYEKARGQNAAAVIRMIHAAERLYYLDWNTFTDLTYVSGPPSSCGGVTGGNGALVTQGYLKCPNRGNPSVRAFNYQVNDLGFGTIQIVATRNSGRYNAGTIFLGVTPPSSGSTLTWGSAPPWPAEMTPQN